MEKLIITAAVTGSLPTKKRTPHVPITPAEIVEAGVRCEQAGAAVIHVHARNPADESASTEFKIFEEIYHGLKQRTNLSSRSPPAAGPAWPTSSAATG